MGKKKKRTGKRNKKKSAQQARPLISLCVIARDEATFLDACLASVREMVDEIVVVDTGSIDHTQSVAHQHGARVCEMAWEGDFSLARNYALEQASGEWILVLDCDETLSPIDRGSLQDLVRSGDRDAYRMTTRNYSNGAQHAGWTRCDGTYPEERSFEGWFPSTKVRLWRQQAEIRFEGVVHELVEPALMRAGIPIGDCLVPVHHYGYAEKERAGDHYLRAGERKVRENPEDIRARYELAIAYRNADQQSAALREIEAALSGASNAKSTDLIYVQEELMMLVRADILTRMGQKAKALAAYDALLQRFPDSHQALNNKGILLEDQGRIDEARRCYERALSQAGDNDTLAENLRRVSTLHTLSVCVVTRDEDLLLKRCLESISGVADQIIVADIGTSGKTAAIVENSGAVRIGLKWNGDFSAIRNAALDRATGDWVLCMDAKEYLLAEDGKEVCQAKRITPDRGLYVGVVEEGGKSRPSQTVKMFPNRPEIRFEQPAYESVLASIKSSGLAFYSARFEIHREPYPDLESAHNEQAYHDQLMSAWLAAHPTDWECQVRFGHLLYGLGRRDAARAFFSCAKEAGERDAPANTRRRALSFYGRCLLEDGSYTEARESLKQALKLAPNDALALLSMGDVAVKLELYQEAEVYLRASLQGDRDADFSLDERAVVYATHFFLGQALSGLGRNEDAIKSFEQANQTAPNRSEARQAIALMRQGIGQGDSGLYMHQPPPLDKAPVEDTTLDGPPGKLSLCMIVRNEESRLGRCLESVRGLVDEIIVVDTGSDDGTISVAKKHGAKVGFFEWCDDFSAARNASISLATGDWIMWLDADDILPLESHAPIRQCISGSREKAYFFVLDDQGYEHISCLQLRLFPNRIDIQFEMPVHEQVTPSLSRIGLEMVQSEIRVLHTGYTTPEVVAGKKERYLKIMERWVEAHPQDYMERSHVALTYYSTDRLEEAERAYRFIIEESTCYADRNWVIYTTALLFLGRTYMKMGRMEDAKTYLLKAENVDRDYILTQLTLAELYAQFEDHAATLEHARSVVENKRQMTFFPIDYDEVTYSAHLLIARSHQALSEWPQAVAAFRNASTVPVDRRGDALGSLSSMYRDLGQLDEARAALEEALVLAPENPDHLFNVGVIDLESKRLERAEQLFEQVIALRPNYTLALLNLGYIAKTQGRLDEAEARYKRAVECDQKGVEARANLAHLLVDQDRYEDALTFFEEVRSLESGLLDIELGYLVSLVNQPQLDWSACSVVLRSLETLLSDWTVEEGDLDRSQSAALRLGELGVLLIRNEMHKCAELALRAAIALQEGLLDMRRLLAEVLFARGSYWQAVAQLEVVLHAEPQDAASFSRLGDCYKQLGVEEAAQMCYARAGGV